MDNIQKLVSDAGKIKKNEYACGSYDYEKCCRKITDLLERNNPQCRNLAKSFGDYWFSSVVMKNQDLSNEPSQRSIDFLAGLAVLLEGDIDSADEFCGVFSEEDWKELCSLTNYESEELNLDLLNNLMMLFVDKGAV